MWCYKRALNILQEIYLGLRNKTNVVIMRMRKFTGISACVCTYLMEIYFIMAVCEHTFWKHKLINFQCLILPYICRKCANWIVYTCSNIITWNQKLPSPWGNSKCTPAKRAWVAYWPYSEQGHTLASRIPTTEGVRLSLTTKATANARVPFEPRPCDAMATSGQPFHSTRSTYDDGTMPSSLHANSYWITLSSRPCSSAVRVTGVSIRRRW